MAQQIVDSKVSEVGLGSNEADLSAEDKQLPVTVKKTPLRDLLSENNIVPQKGSVNPLVLKEAVITEAAKVSGVKRPSPETQMNTHQQSPKNNGSNGHLVYVRRKSEIETGKTSNNEVLADNAQCPPPKQPVHQEDRVQPKCSINGAPIQWLSANAPLPTSTVSIPPGNPTIPLALGTSDTKMSSEEHWTQTISSPINLTAEPSVNKLNWEERYIHLQVYLKKIDQSSLEEHLQALRSLSAAELSRHAVELEKRAIQLSLEQGKELQRVKALNVLGKSLRTPNGPPFQQTMQN